MMPLENFGLTRLFTGNFTFHYLFPESIIIKSKESKTLNLFSGLSKEFNFTNNILINLT